MNRDIPPPPAAREQATLAAGDRIRSLYAGRTGTVVKVYPDGSACICWDHRPPQAEGLGHERMPRALLTLTDHPYGANDQEKL